MDCSVNFLGKNFRSPLIGTSGTIGFGYDFAELISLNHFGGLVFKTLTPQPLLGNALPRVAEIESGLINSIGLQNPGIDEFIKNIYPRTKKLKVVKIVSLGGFTILDFVSSIKKISLLPEIDFLELNVSCPNVDYHNKEFSTDSKLLKELLQECQKLNGLPLIVKLSPNVTSISKMARVVKDNGGVAVCVGNTFKALSIDIHSRKPLVDTGIGGCSGPAIKSLMLAKVYEVAQEVDIPLIGVGGVTCGEDVIEYFLAGADLVGIGTVNLINPQLSKKIFKVMQKFCKQTNTHPSKLKGNLNFNYH